MNIKTMRQMDYWIGKILCFVLDGIHAILKAIRGRSDSKPKNIIFFEFSEAGSILLIYSALQRAKQAFPDASLYFLSFASQKPGLSLIDLLQEDRIMVIRSDNIFAFIIETCKAIVRMRKLRIDTVIDCELFSRFSSIVSSLSGARNRVGFYQFTGEGLYRGKHMTHKVLYNPYQHMTKNFLALIHALETNAAYDNYRLKETIADEEVIRYTIPTTEAEHARGLALIRDEYPNFTGKEKIILVNPHPGLLPLRGWPLKNYIDLISKLLEQSPDCLIVLLGLPEATSEVRRITHAITNARIINLVGKTKSVIDIVDLCHCADMLITNDSGPAHYATLTDIHIVVFFGPETPVLYKPLGENVHAFYAGLLCSPCLSAKNHRLSHCRNNACLQAITVEDIHQAIRSIHL